MSGRHPGTLISELLPVNMGVNRRVFANFWREQRPKLFTAARTWAGLVTGGCLGVMWVLWDALVDS